MSVIDGTPEPLSGLEVMAIVRHLEDLRKEFRDLSHTERDKATELDQKSEAWFSRKFSQIQNESRAEMIDRILEIIREREI